MPEQEWNQEQAVESCLHKGGFSGTFDDAIKSKVKVTRYQTSLQHMDYNDTYSVFEYELVGYAYCKYIF
ncbi:MAG: hypothetical protein EZS28_036380 [Streblomastix strix]|uniref:AMMECR1 domain-containing protein n=1 Tax=Streblomastix strix TaxID=222440 RepID=A0A5J4UER0_9EUKA|nr:MAG: hypothetical protein EZS28_036380 [Streblomastix strix]